MLFIEIQEHNTNVIVAHIRNITIAATTRHELLNLPINGERIDSQIVLIISGLGIATSVLSLLTTQAQAQAGLPAKPQLK